MSLILRQEVKDTGQRKQKIDPREESAKHTTQGITKKEVPYMTRDREVSKQKVFTVPELAMVSGSIHTVATFLFSTKKVWELFQGFCQY